MQTLVKEQRGFLTLSNVKKFGLGATLGGAMVLAPQVQAASSLDFSGITSEVDGVKTAIIALVGALVVILGITLAWRYFKRSAN